MSSTTLTNDGFVATATSTQHGAAPLTTVFTTPDICKPLYWTDVATPPLSSSICMPNGWKQYWDYGFGFYSPAICPSGYTRGCAFPTSLAIETLGTPILGGALTTGETARMCCPIGYTCYTGTAGEASAYSKCISTNSMTTYLDLSNPTTYTLTSTLALVYGIQVRWRESDLSILETDPTVPGSKYSAAPSTATATANPTVNDFNNQITGNAGSPALSVVSATAGVRSTLAAPATPSNGLGISRVATIGLAMAIPLISVLLGTLAFFLWRQHYRKQEDKKNHDPPDGNEPDKLDLHPDSPTSQSLMGMTSPMTPRAPSELDSYSMFGSDTNTMSEMEGATLGLKGRATLEMATVEKPQELPAPNFIAELEGDAPQPPQYKEKL